MRQSTEIIERHGSSASANGVRTGTFSVFCSRQESIGFRLEPWCFFSVTEVQKNSRLQAEGVVDVNRAPLGACERAPLGKLRSRDPDEVSVPACALASGASTIISTDKGLHHWESTRAIHARTDAPHRSNISSNALARQSCGEPTLPSILRTEVFRDSQTPMPTPPQYPAPNRDRLTPLCERGRRKKRSGGRRVSAPSTTNSLCQAEVLKQRLSRDGGEPSRTGQPSPTRTMLCRVPERRNQHQRWTGCSRSSTGHQVQPRR